VIVPINERTDTASCRALTNINPTPQFLRAVHNHFVPHFGFLFDTLAVAEQTDVREVRCAGVKLLKYFAGERHPYLVNQCVRDFVLAQQVEELGSQPLFIANFQCEPVIFWEFIQEGLETRHREEQIAFALRQAETGTAVGEVIRKMGISTQTFYRL